MILEMIVTTYALMVLAIMLIGMTFGSVGMGWDYYRGLLLMALLWPYALYRGLRD